MTVIVGKGGGAKPPKPKAHVPVGNKGPRGTAPVYQPPPPKPAPSYHAPPASTKTGGNPRGISIPKHKPKPTINDKQSHFLGTGDNPRGVSHIKPPKTHLGIGGSKGVKAKISKSSGGGGGLLGVIENPTAAIASVASPALHVITHIPASIESHITPPPIVGKIAINSLKDLRDLPEQSVEGVGTIGSAVVKDIIYDSKHGNFAGPVPLPGPNITKLAKGAVDSSVTKKIIEGHIGAAAKQFIQHPVDTGLEFAGGVGVAGRVLGAAARSGVVGARVAEAAKLARDTRELTPGLPGDVRHYSPNVFRKGGQVAIERLPKPGIYERAMRDNRLRRNTNIVHSLGTTMKHQDQEKLAHDMHKAIKGDHRFKTPRERKVAADVASMHPQALAQGANYADHMRDLLKKIEASHHDWKGSERALKESKKNAKNIRAFLEHPDVKAFNEIAKDYTDRQKNYINPELIKRGLLSPEQAARSDVMPYIAAGHMPHVRILAKDERTIRSLHWRAAANDVAAAKKAVHKIEIENAKLPNGHKAAGVERLKEAKANLKEAIAARQGLDKYRNEKLGKGTIVTDVKHEDLRGPSSYGVQRIPVSEIHANMRANYLDPEQVTHVNLRMPEDDEAASMQSGTSMSRRDGPDMRRTAKGIPTGAFKAGHTAMADSQIRDINRIHNARSWDMMVQHGVVHGPHRKPIALSLDEAKKFATEYSKDNKIKMDVVPLHSAARTGEAADRISEVQSLPPVAEDGKLTNFDDMVSANPDQRFGIMPHTMVRTYQKHIEQEHRYANSVFSPINRQFRNTVLAFSPKWLAGNDIEGTMRTLLDGGGPRDHALVGKVIARMRADGNEEGAQRMEATMSGQHYGMSHRRNMDAIGAGALHSASHEELMSKPILAQARQLGTAYTRSIIEPIYHVNRKFEGGFDRTILGSHMARQMREMGATWLEAAKHEEAWIQKLADGYGSDPALALDAVKHIHKVLGQYNAFSPLAKRIMNTVAPFAPWYWNAVRFVYYTMPADHPIVQATLLAAARTQASAYASQDKALGDLADPTGGHKFSELYSDLPVGKPGTEEFTNPGRYLPWGALTGGPMNFGMSQFAPQASDMYNAMVGLDPFGRPLADKNGDVHDQLTGAGVALNELLLGFGGPANTLNSIVNNHGDTAYNTSTVWNPQTKPDTHHGGPGLLGGLERTEIPGFPTYLRRKPKTSSSSKSSSSSTGLPSITLSGQGLPKIGLP